MIRPPYQSLRTNIRGRTKAMTTKMLATQTANVGSMRGATRRWRRLTSERRKSGAVG
jgi:hypothetical protein